MVLNNPQVVAQNMNPLFLKNITHKKASLGYDIGIGVGQMHLDSINHRLQELQVGQILDVLVNAQFNFYIESEQGAGLSLSGNWGIAVSDVYKQNTYLDFNTLGFGVTGYIPLLYSNRIGFWATGGIRTNIMHLDYNYNRVASANFNNLFTSPAANTNTFSLISSGNQLASFGAKFQYRLWRKEKLKPYEIRFGINSDYNYSYQQNPWREIRSRSLITDMPNISPNNFSFVLTASILGTLNYVANQQF